MGLYPIDILAVLPHGVDRPCNIAKVSFPRIQGYTSQIKPGDAGVHASFLHTRPMRMSSTHLKDVCSGQQLVLLSELVDAI